MTVGAEILGFVAGVVVATSPLRRVYCVYKSPKLAATEDMARNVMQCAGNLLWVVYGYRVEGVALMVMCSVAVLMTGFLSLAKMRESRKLSRLRRAV